MITEIRSEQCVDSNGDLSVEASTLGWPPGFWPQRVKLDGVELSGLPIHHGDEFAGYRYFITPSRTLTIIND